MEFMKNIQLVKKDKTEVEADEALANAEIIGFYFSAHWCGPCRAFTPSLAEAYKQMKDDGCNIEIIFVTFDNDEDAMYSYMNDCHGDWFAVPFGSETIRELEQKYSVSGIPKLVIVKKDGKLVTTDGRASVENSGAQAYKSWVE